MVAEAHPASSECLPSLVKKKKKKKLFFAEAEWENEMARQILVLYGSTKSDGPVDDGDQFAIDADALAKCRKKREEPRSLIPKKVYPVWFLGSGALTAQWSALPESSDFEAKLGALEEAGHYLTYVSSIEASLNAYAEHVDLSSKALFSRLWRQLVVSANVFGLRLVEEKKYAAALELLVKAEELASANHLLLEDTRELLAFVDDSYAYYYFRRSKARAALSYAARAQRAHLRARHYPHLAKAYLHSAAILSRLGRHSEALTHITQVLAMVRQGQLDLGGSSPHKLCMIAIAYHNLAVELLYLSKPQQASIAAQNGRRLSRLCLSYSNRWLNNFEATHQAATLAVLTVAASKEKRIATQTTTLTVPSRTTKRIINNKTQAAANNKATCFLARKNITHQGGSPR